MFDGRSQPNRVVSGGNASKRESTAKELIENTRKLREKRGHERIRNTGAIKIQSLVRSFIVKRKVFSELKIELDKKITNIKKIKAIFLLKHTQFSVPISVFLSILRLFYFLRHIRVEVGGFYVIAQVFYESITNSADELNLLSQILNSSKEHNIWCYYMRKLLETLFSLVEKRNEEFVSINECQKLYDLSTVVLQHVLKNSTYSDELNLKIDQISEKLSKKSFELIRMIYLKKENSISAYFAEKVVGLLIQVVLRSLSYVFNQEHGEQRLPLDVFERLSSLQQSAASHPALDLFRGLATEVLTVPRLHAAPLEPLFSFLSGGESAIDFRPWLLCLRLIAGEEPSAQQCLLLDNLCGRLQLLPALQRLEQLTGPIGGAEAPFLGAIADQGQELLWPLLADKTDESAPATTAAADEDDSKGLSIAVDGVRRLEISADQSLVSLRRLRGASAMPALAAAMADPLLLLHLIDRPLDASSIRLILLAAHLNSAVLLTTHSQSAPLLNALAFGRSLQPAAHSLWQMFGNPLLCGDGQRALHTALLLTDDGRFNALHGTNRVSPSLKALTALQHAAGILALSTERLAQLLTSAFHLFCCCFFHQLAATDDEEFFQSPFNTGDAPPVRSVVLFLRDLLRRLFSSHSVQWSPPASKASVQAPQGLSQDLLLTLAHRQQLQLAATKLFNALYARAARRNYMESVEQWHWTGPFVDPAYEERLRAGGREPGDWSCLFLSDCTPTVLACIPQVVPFQDRLQVFQIRLQADKDQQGGSAMFPVQGLHIRVRREALVEDAFTALAAVNPETLKKRIQVEFVSQQGLPEAGIDGGGLFKAFMDAFTTAAFDPLSGLFLSTSQQLLAPNPASGAIAENHRQYFYFFGKMLGLAVYHRILVEPQFDTCFLNTLLDRQNSLDDLWLSDQALHRSLMAVKHLIAAPDPDPIAAMGLFFEADRASLFGERSEPVELVPGGSAVPVTRANALSYLHRFAHFKMNVETFTQCRAFLAGFRLFVPVDLIRMFDPRELRLLISGDGLRPLDIADMRASVHYGGGYHDSQPYIASFWSIISSLTPLQQGKLLKFVTSCSRQPLLGFKQLNPRFGIQRVSARDFGDAPSASRLPSAATCFNLLKLPQYDSTEELRDKLLYVIESDAGFELS